MNYVDEKHTGPQMKLSATAAFICSSTQFCKWRLQDFGTRKKKTSEGLNFSLPYLCQYKILEEGVINVIEVLLAAELYESL